MADPAFEIRLGHGYDGPAHNPGLGQVKCVSYDDAKLLPFQVEFKKAGIPLKCVEWCRKNCNQDFGWYFDTSYIVASPHYLGVAKVTVAFAYENDMFMFQLYWGEEFGEERK